jgi:TetR/AcrR family transcriptional regulator, transcriptional repressor for nem operon
VRVFSCAASHRFNNASIYLHFQSKADLGAAVARRTWQDTAANSDPKKALKAYPELFRRSLEQENRMCLCSFLVAKYNDLPDTVKTEEQAFADVDSNYATLLS